MTEDISILIANREHDRKYGRLEDFYAKRIRPSWNEARLSGRGPLTDKQIEKYQKLGWFTEEFRRQRLLLAEKRKGRKPREGNFDIVEGRLVYRPE